MKSTLDYFTSLQETLAAIAHEDIETTIGLMWSNYVGGRRTVFCGNGGSAATASHLPADFQKTMFLEGGRAWECLSIVDSVPLLTAWGNDTSYANVFAAQAQCWLRPGDLLIAISGSGNSPNVLEAIKAARGLGATTIAWTGFGGGQASSLAEYNIIVPSNNMQVVEDVHMVMGHAIFTVIRDRMLSQAGTADASARV